MALQNIDLNIVTKNVWDSIKEQPIINKQSDENGFRFEVPIRTDNPNDYGESLWRCSQFNDSWNEYKNYLNIAAADYFSHGCCNDGRNYRGSVWRDATPSDEFIRQKCNWTSSIDYEYNNITWRCTYKDDIIGTVVSEFIYNDELDIPYFIPVEQKRETENKVIEAVQKIYREQYYRREFGMNIKESAIFEESMKIAHGRIVEVNHEIGTPSRAVIEMDANMLKNMRIEMPTTDFDKKGCTCNKYTANGIPAVSKVEVYNDRVVKVIFTDGTFTKSVCSENDVFDIDVGITVCVMKRMLGKDGNKLYNNMIRDIHETMEKNIKKKEEVIAKKAEERNKKRKVELKKAAKKAKARQEQIDIQKTAMVEALHAYKMETGDDMK